MIIVLETQTNVDGTIGIIPVAYNESEKSVAESKYHTILASAATSTLPRHTAFMLTDDGYVVKSECYKHEVEPESEVSDG